jgi:chromatin structure-remodeling complex subunit RSC1/2
MQDQRGTEVYVLSNIANESIPKHIRDRFPQDDEGRVLFFTQPPVLPDTLVRGRDGQPLAHTEKYLAAKAERDKIVATRKRAREEANSTPFKKGRLGTAV